MTDLIETTQREVVLTSETTADIIEVLVQGPEGQTGPPGPAGGGVTWRGAWSAVTAYAVNDGVTHSGSSWRRVIAGTTATAPEDDAVNWTLIALKGDTGDIGPTGNTGPAGDDGADGADGAPGADGADGDTGATGAAGPSNVLVGKTVDAFGALDTGKAPVYNHGTGHFEPVDIATQAELEAAIAALINGAPGALDTLNELAAQLTADESTAAALATTVAGKLAKASNLSDLTDAATARTNLGLGTAATHPATDFQTADADLTAIAALATDAFGRDLLIKSSAAAIRTYIAAIASTLVDAKGDLVTATADDTPARLAVGSNGKFLKADSAQSTGLAWDDPVTARTTVAWTTASLANNADETSGQAIAKASQCYSITTDRAARVRAYSTSAHRTADAARAAGTDPTGNHGCLLDVVTTGAMLTVDLSPVVDLVNMDGSPATTIYFDVTNVSGSTSTVTVTLTVRKSE